MIGTHVITFVRTIRTFIEHLVVYTIISMVVECLIERMVIIISK